MITANELRTQQYGTHRVRRDHPSPGSVSSSGLLLSDMVEDLENMVCPAFLFASCKGMFKPQRTVTTLADRGKTERSRALYPSDANHRMISTYVNTLRSNGIVLHVLLEPEPDKDLIEWTPEMASLQIYFVAQCVRSPT